MTLYFDVTILKDFDGFIFVFIFPNKAGFSWIYTVANFFPSSSVISTIPFMSLEYLFLLSRLQK